LWQCTFFINAAAIPGGRGPARVGVSDGNGRSELSAAETGGILLSPKTARGGATTPLAAADAGWTLLGRFGVVLAIVGFADFLLVFYPGRFGDPTWEFAAIDAAFSSLPVLTIGLALMLAAGAAGGAVKWVRTCAAFAILLAVAILGLMLMYATNIPLALRLSPPEVLPGIYKSIIRTVLMAVVFGAGYIIAGITAWRRTRTIVG
jgi:hypothetical protein